jgi:putative transposase
MIRENLSQASNQDLGGEDAHPTGQYQLFVGQASSLPLKLRDAQLKVTYRNLPHWELEPTFRRSLNRIDGYKI